jgi:hypothetical protein
MKAVNSAVLVSYAVKLVPVLMMALVMKGCVTKEQADAATPLLNDLVTWVAGGIGVISLVIGWFRSLKVYGNK